MSILERCLLNPVFWKRGQRRPTPFCVKRRECGRACKHCSGLVAAFSTVCNGYRYTRKPFSVCTILLCIAVCRPCTCVPGCTCLTCAPRKIVKSLANDYPSYTTTPMWFWGWSYNRGSTVVLAVDQVRPTLFRNHKLRPSCVLLIKHFCAHKLYQSSISRA